MDGLGKLADLVKLSPRYVVPLAIALALLLFGPRWLLDGLGARPFVLQSRPYLGATLLLFVVMMLHAWIPPSAQWVVSWVKQQFTLRALRARTHDLSDAEKAILRGYFDEGTNTQYFDLSDGVVSGLEHAKIIYQASIVGQDMTIFAYNLQLWARTYLRAHPELLYDAHTEANGQGRGREQSIGPLPAG
jgi:hypothetical protein